MDECLFLQKISKNNFIINELNCRGILIHDMAALAKDHIQRPRTMFSGWNDTTLTALVGLQTHPYYAPLIPNNDHKVIL